MELLPHCSELDITSINNDSAKLKDSKAVSLIFDIKYTRIISIATVILATFALISRSSQDGGQIFLRQSLTIMHRVSITLFVAMLVAATLSGLGFLYFLYLRGMYADVFGKRHHRVDKECPSSRNHLSPKVIGLSRERFFSLKNLLSPDKREVRAFKIWKSGISVFKKHHSKMKHASQAHRDAEILSKEELELIEQAGDDFKNILRANFMKEKEFHAEKLDMDHVRITFSEFIWGMFFIYSGTVLLAVYGSIILNIRRWLHKHSVISPKSRSRSSFMLAGSGTTDPARLCADVCLETTIALHYKDISREDGRTLARFEINNLPIMTMGPTDTEAKYELCHQLVMFIDVNEMRLTRTIFHRTSDETIEHISDIDALCLIYFYLATSCHVKGHSFANWGIDEMHSDPYIRRLSSITVLYNYLGLQGYPSAVKTFSTCGMMYDHSEAIRAIFDKAIDSGIPAHMNIRDLIPYSSLVRFLVPARNIFMKHFMIHANRFRGIEGEAWFVGSIVHSLDHVNIRDIISDPLLFIGARPEFIPMVEANMHIWACFSTDIPIIGGKYLFPRKMSDSQDPFHKAVYKECVCIGKKEANDMDVCISH